jgi:hypothetical protein
VSDFFTEEVEPESEHPVGSWAYYMDRRAPTSLPETAKDATHRAVLGKLQVTD